MSEAGLSRISGIKKQYSKHCLSLKTTPSPRTPDAPQKEQGALNHNHAYEQPRHDLQLPLLNTLNLHP